MSRPSYQIPVMSAKDRLDRLDRQIIEAVCKHGREGQSFNKLVEEVKPLASRSTFAFRAKRLQRLGYTEPFDDSKSKQVKRIRGKPLTLLITRLVVRIRSQCEELTSNLTQQEAKKENATADEDFAKKKQVEDASYKIKGIFSLIPTYALYFGEAAAGGSSATDAHG